MVTKLAMTYGAIGAGRWWIVGLQNQLVFKHYNDRFAMYAAHINDFTFAADHISKKLRTIS